MVFWLLFLPGAAMAMYAFIKAAEPSSEPVEEDAVVEHEVEDPAPAYGDVQGKELRAMARESAVLTVYRIARAEAAALKVANPHAAGLMVTSHGALETGWFEHFVDSNLFGMTALPGQPQVKAKDAGDGYLQFRLFGSVNEGIREYLALVKRKYTLAFQHVDSGDPESYAAGLKAGGYYSAPLEKFTAALENILARVTVIVEESE